VYEFIHLLVILRTALRQQIIENDASGLCRLTPLGAARVAPEKLVRTSLFLRTAPAERLHV